MENPSQEVPDLLSAWVTGWAGIRNYETSFETGCPAALRHDRGGGWEYFVCNPAPGEFAALAEKVAKGSGESLAVVGPDVHRYVHQAHLAHLQMVSVADCLMQVDMALMDTQDPYLPDPDFTLETKHLAQSGDCTCTNAYAVTIVHGTDVVAGGKVSITADGVAVFDQIETTFDYRRQGFGRLVMQALASRAMDHGAHTGLLLASQDGQQRYAKLGWERLWPMTVLEPPAEKPAASSPKPEAEPDKQVPVKQLPLRHAKETGGLVRRRQAAQPEHSEPASAQPAATQLDKAPQAPARTAPTPQDRMQPTFEQPAHAHSARRALARLFRFRPARPKHGGTHPERKPPAGSE